MTKSGKLPVLLAGAALSCLLLAGCSEETAVEVPGAGTVREREKLENGVEYGVTDLDYAVVLRVPGTVEELDLTELEEGRAGVYFLASALEEAEKLRAVTLGTSAAFDGELLERFRALPEFTYPEDCMTSDWVVTVEQAEAVNEVRRENGLPETAPDLELTRLSRRRTEELAEEWDVDRRPDGRGWPPFWTRRDTTMSSRPAIPPRRLRRNRWKVRAISPSSRRRTVVPPTSAMKRWGMPSTGWTRGSSLSISSSPSPPLLRGRAKR